ncbi:type IV toxin-antitoxin system AbiEi family antitoxin domain-containing protein [Sphingomonas aquatilis]|uniref:type IV toxin-antitoxin system AbiEi family antitoxin domain-containing protein n=1 Tax=Sphingomonas aquatilis TaxID=93063 RepID=UPI0023F9CC6A|nr:type IV toxin-antitoxin system AbiEi family antitoxin domain-containing protein [Sphingomonas aquatilis]MCI4654030.1 type IV toxin-antitoxin system AbiEi family antitoxin domain-containing protein [Sphingomonas aquatilis]
MRGPTRRSLRSLSVAEAALIRMLRTGADAASGSVRIAASEPIATGSITQVTAHLNEAGCRLAEPATPFLTGDEQLTLASIALLQRQASQAIRFQNAARRKVLAQLAHQLDDAGVRLPLNQAVVAVLRTQGWLNPDATVGPTAVSERRRKAEARPIKYVTRGTAKWKIVEYLRHHERASAARLEALGITRQYISLLCADGIIDRVAFGYYALGKRVRALDCD